MYQACPSNAGQAVGRNRLPEWAKTREAPCVRCRGGFFEEFPLYLADLIGGLIGAAYLLARDGLSIDLMPERSIGKKALGLRPVRLDGSPMDLATSIKRNWMFALGGVVQALLFIPILGWLLMLPVAFACLLFALFEGYKVLTDPDGRRLGDRWAGTRVVTSQKGYS